MQHYLVLTLWFTTGCASVFHTAGGKMAEGMVHDLTSDDREDDVNVLVDRVVASLASSVETKLAPALQDSVRELVRGSLEEATNADSQARLQQVTEALILTVTDTLAQRSEAGLRDRIGPAVAQVVRRDLLPLLEEAMRGPRAEAAVQLAEQVAGGLARGMASEGEALGQSLGRSMADGLAASLAPQGELGKALEAQRVATAQTVQGQVANTEAVADRLTDRAVGALGSLAVLLGLGGGLAGWMWWRSRRQAQEYGQAIELLTTTIRQEADRGGGVEELVGSLRGVDRSAEGAAALDAFLEARPYLKVPKRKQGTG